MSTSYSWEGKGRYGSVEALYQVYDTFTFTFATLGMFYQEFV